MELPAIGLSIDHCIFCIMMILYKLRYLYEIHNFENKYKKYVLTTLYSSGDHIPIGIIHQKFKIN